MRLINTSMAINNDFESGAQTFIFVLVLWFSFCLGPTPGGAQSLLKVLNSGTTIGGV